MKIIMVLGSPRNESISTRLAMRFADGAKEAGHEIKIYNINDMNVKGCQGCGVCRKSDSTCVVADDLKEYFNELNGAEAVVIASPNYYSHPIGPMITFMNRHYCLMNAAKEPRIKEAKKLFAFFAQGAPENLEKYLPNYEWYTSVFGRMNINLEKQIIAGGDSNIDALLDEAYKMGKML